MTLMHPPDSRLYIWSVVCRTKELNNGRLAMIAVAGFVAQELVNHKGIIENLRASAA
jgi:hypothetical protein